MDLLRSRRSASARRGVSSYSAEDGDDMLRIQGICALTRSLAGLASITIPGRDIVVPWDKLLPPDLAYYLAVDEYEHHDLEMIKAYVRSGDQALELGGGIGITGVALAQATGRRVVVLEPNPDLHERIKRTFAINGAGLELIEAAASTSSGSTWLQVCDSYWWSNIQKDEHSSILVRTIALKELLDLHEPTVLLVDIEGHEQAIAGMELPSALRLVIMEIHTPDIGVAETAKVAAWLFAQGFVLRDLRANSWAFERP
jgi:FkbM family methyltransferase